MTVGYYLDRKIGIRIDIHLDVPIKVYGANYFLDYLSEEQFKDLISDFKGGKIDKVDNVLNFIGPAKKHLVKVWVQLSSFTYSLKYQTKNKFLTNVLKDSYSGTIGFKLEQKKLSRCSKYCLIQNMRKHGEDCTRLVGKIEDNIKNNNITFEELIGNMWKELSTRRDLLKSTFYLGRPGIINLLGLYAAGYHNINMLNKKYKYLR